MKQFVNALVLAALCAGAIAYAWSTPPDTPFTRAAGEFSSPKAMDHVRQIASGPHPTGSAANDSVRAYIVASLKSLGLTPEIQEATGVGTRYPTAGRVRNIVVRMPGTQPGGLAVLVMTHYDGVPAGPAAGDDAAGTAALLETLRALRAGEPLVHDVIALFTDSEEQGLLGAAAFVREHRWAKDAGVILNFEGRGVSGPSLMFETGQGNMDVVRVLRSVHGARATSLSTAVYRRLPNDTDLSETMSLGKPSMNFAFIGDVARYHTAEDDVAHLSEGSLRHHGVQMLALAREFANGPLPRPVTPDATFFFAPGLGTVVYPESWSLPLAALALIAALALLVAVRGKESGWLGFGALGAGAGLLSPVLGGVAGYAIALAALALHLKIGSGQPALSGVYALACALLAIAASLAVHQFARKRGAKAVNRGSLVLWGVLSVALAVALPAASYLVTWPLVGALIASATSERVRWQALVGRWFGAFAVVVLVAPTAFLMVVVALGLDATGGAILGVLAAMATSLVAPVILDGARPWRMPATAAALGVVVFATAAALVRTNARTPVGSGMVYATDSVSSWLTGYSTGPGGASWVREVLDTFDRPGNTPAPAWLSRLSGGRRAVKVNGPALSLAASARVLWDSTKAGERRVSVRVKPAPGTLGIGLRLDSAVVTSSVVDGRSVDTRGYRRRGAWSLDFVAPPDSGFVITLAFQSGGQPRLSMFARRPGLPTLSAAIPARPAGVLPVQSGDISVAYRLVKF